MTGSTSCPGHRFTQAALFFVGFLSEVFQSFGDYVQDIDKADGDGEQT